MLLEGAGTLAHASARNRISARPRKRHTSGLAGTGNIRAWAPFPILSVLGEGKAEDCSDDQPYSACLPHHPDLARRVDRAYGGLGPDDAAGRTSRGCRPAASS